MDKTIARTKKRPYLIGVLLLLGLASGAWLLRFGAPVADLRIPQDTLTIRPVEAAGFYEYINLTGRVAPGFTRLLDCRIPGTVERRYVESGDRVQAGDTLLRLRNPELELEVMQRESQLIEQLNTQRQTALLLNQNDFTRREQLVDIDYQLALETQRYRRETSLVTDGLLAAADYEPTAARFAYYTARRRLLRDAYRQDSLSRSSQLGQLAVAEQRLLANLDAVRGLLDQLYVTAPAAGLLGDFNLSTGEGVVAGQRLGELYRMDAPQVEADVDEFYLNKVRLDQPGALLYRNDSLPVRVAKIFPAVEGGRFRIRLRPAAGADFPAFTKGQSVRVRLYFGESRTSTLLAGGDFYNSTGGNWVFVVENGSAVRRDVRLGRRNPDYHEVLDGLQPGDRVITSDYRAFKDYQRLQLSQ